MRKLKHALVFLLLATPAFASADGWHLLIEPKFMRNEIAWPIEGSDQTVLVPARVVGDAVVPQHRANAARVQMDRKALFETASKVLAGLKPEFVRDSRGVIQYAVLASDDPLTASAVLAPDFAARFADTIGPDMIIAIPSRNKIFLFPNLTPTYLDRSETVILEYKSSPFPVSMELFSIKDGRLTAIGRYQ